MSRSVRERVHGPLAPVVGPWSLQLLCRAAAAGAADAEEEVSLTKEDRILLERVGGRGETSTTFSPSAFPLVNVGKIGKVDNLVDLNFLHEPAILFALRERFKCQQPYTRTGNIVVAVNPYRWIEALYGKDKGLKYLHCELNPDDARHHGVDLRPHVYFISSRAFAGMVSSKKSQSILVSGESGAGKTETTKIVITHLVCASEQSSRSDPETKGLTSTGDTPASRVLGSNHLLEAFGNAKTVRNDNSSRFGKYTSLQFDSTTHAVLGCKAQVYLLEKSRVVTQSSSERNYHIFYQLLRGPPLATLARVGLAQGNDTGTAVRAKPSDFPYLANGNLTVEGVDDGKQFSRTIEGLNCIGVLDDMTAAMLESIASVLHLGCLAISSRGDDASTVGDVGAAQDSKHHGVSQGVAAAGCSSHTPLHWCCRLLGVTAPGLVDALCSRIVITPTETYQVPCKAKDAMLRREALAKDLYSRVFLWLVGTINAFIAYRGDGDGSGISRPDCNISILDIFGFESFEHNSFEQLCINYANEKLQQRFTKDVFRSVQDEYVAEGIDWVKIDYADNTDCLKMIEGRLGLLAILEEETARASTDEKLSNKLSRILSDNRYFDKPRLVRCGFEIQHYAGSVRYDANTFLEKNADALAPDITTLLRSSSVPFVAQLYNPAAPADHAASAHPPTQKKKRSRRGSSIFMKTVTSGFRASLSDLMREIGKTNVGYIRCIKPNATKSASAFDNRLVCDQLRYCGVVEAVAISRAAFPNRLSYGDLVDRFFVLGGLVLAAKQKAKDYQFTADELKTIMASKALGVGLPEGKDSYVVGKTQVFFATGILEGIEALREGALVAAAIRIQTQARRFSARRAFMKLLASILIQREVRKKLAVLCYQKLRSGSLLAQKVWRCRVCARAFATTRKNVLIVQCAARIWRAQSQAAARRRCRASVAVQTIWRARRAVRVFRSLRGGIVRLQAEARRQASQRWVNNMREVAAEEAKLESKILALQRQMTEQAERHAAELLATQHAAAMQVSSDRVSEEERETSVSVAKAEATAVAAMNSVVDRLRQENTVLKKENKELKDKVRLLESSARVLEARVENQASVSTATKRRLVHTLSPPFSDENTTSHEEDGSVKHRRRKAGKSRVARKLLHSMSNMTPPPEPMTVKKRSVARALHSSSAAWGTPSSEGATPGSSTRRRSWLRRMFSATNVGFDSALASTSASFPLGNDSPKLSPGNSNDTLRKQCGRSWKVIKHAEWQTMVQPFYCHLRIITGGMGKFRGWTLRV